MVSFVPDPLASVHLHTFRRPFELQGDDVAVAGPLPERVQRYLEVELGIDRELAVVETDVGHFHVVFSGGAAIFQLKRFHNISN